MMDITRYVKRVISDDAETEVDADVVVIGSGVGGLAAAALLARSGARVIVLERRGKVGGRMGTVEREGCLLPSGAILIPTGEYLEQLFVELGLRFEVEPIRARSVYWLGETDRRSFEMPERGALRALLTEAAGADDAQRILDALRSVLAGAPPPETTMLGWLSTMTSSPDALGAFAAMAGAFLGVNGYEVSAAAFVEYLRYTARGGGGVGYARHGAGELSDDLAATIRTDGGEIWLRAAADAIEVDDDGVRAVLVRRQGAPTRIQTREVISDVGPVATIEMLGAAVDPNLQATIRKRLAPSPGVVHFLVSDEPLVDTSAPVLPARGGRVCLVCAPSILVPDLAPPGKHWLEVICTVEDSTDHSAASTRAAGQAGLEDLDRLIPDWQSRARLLTTLTYRAEWPIYRAWPGTDAQAETGVAGLNWIGDGVKPAGVPGTAGAVAGARRAVAALR